MKFGIIGSAHPHVFSFVEGMLSAGWEFCGIVADGETNTRTLVERYNLLEWATPGELFAQGIGVVGCFAPNADRIEIVEECARRGVHVMCDKPLVVSARDYERLEKVIGGKQIQVGMMFTIRFMPSVRGLKSVLESGEIGQIVNIEMFNPHKLTPEKRPPWHFSRERGGSVAADLFTHSIDTFHWLTDRSAIIAHESILTKSTLPGKPEFYDFANALVRTKTGISGYFRVDWHIPDAHWAWGDMRIFCTGTTGYAEVRGVGDPLTHAQELIVFSPDTGTEKRSLPQVEESETSDFLARIEGLPHIITHADILYACRVALELEAGALVNNRVKDGTV